MDVRTILDNLDNRKALQASVDAYLRAHLRADSPVGNYDGYRMHAAQRTPTGAVITGFLLTLPQRTRPWACAAKLELENGSVTLCVDERGVDLNREGKALEALFDGHWTLTMEF